LPKAAVDAAWFKPNPDQTGLYRSNYSMGMVEALETPLLGGDLRETDRFGLVDDVFAAAEAGLTDSAVALKLVEALRAETDYTVWAAVTGGFGSLENVVENQALRDRLDNFGHWLVQPNVARLGWEPHAGEPVFDTLMRPLVLAQAVRFDDEAVSSEARRRFDDFVAGRPVNPDLRPVALYAAARNGGETEYNAMLERYRTEQSPQLKMSLLGSMGRFRKPELIQRYLDFGLSPEVRPQDIYIVMAWSFRNRDGRELAWKWVKHNWDEFIRRYGEGGKMLDRFPLYAAGAFASQAMAREIKEFFEKHPHPSTSRSTPQAVESVELKADWFARDKASIARWLKAWEAKRK
jgi:puromycin-sensitive aminopeptidase